MTLITALFTTHLLCTTCNDGAWSANQLVGVHYNGYTAATMINSFSERSYVAAYDWQHDSGNYGIFLGAAAGYESAPVNIGGVMPVVAPYVKIKLFRAILFGDAIAITREVNL